jgi:periplasmic protein TonB
MAHVKSITGNQKKRYSFYSVFLSAFFHFMIAFLLIYAKTQHMVHIEPLMQPITIMLERAPLRDFVTPQSPAKPAKPKEEKKKEEAVPPPVEVAMSAPIQPETLVSAIEQEIIGDSMANKGSMTAIVTAAELDDSLFKAYYQPLPAYPWLPRSMGVEGKVIIKILVAPNGTVVDHTLLSVEGHPSFGLAAAQAVCQYKFPPPRSKGRPVYVWLEIPIVFVLE